MFRSRGFIFRKTVLYTGMVFCVLHAEKRFVVFSAYIYHTYIYTRLPEDESVMRCDCNKIRLYSGVLSKELGGTG
jgi:hypothetical protein